MLDPRSLRRFTACAALFVLASEARPQAESAPASIPASAPASAPAAERSAQDPAERARLDALLAADKQVAIGKAGAEQALELLRSTRDATEHQRAVALAALGVAKHAEGRELLESQARYGPGAERIAAIAALGDLGAPNLALFSELVRDADPSVRGSACLALCFAGAVMRVAELSATAQPEIAATAQAAIDFARAPLEHLDFEPGVLRLELRARAAERFGLPPVPPPAPATATQTAAEPAAPAAQPSAPSAPPVTSDATPAALQPATAPRGPTGAELGALLILAAELDRPAIRDHLLELLLDGGSPEVAAAAVRLLPEQVSQMMLAGVWRPPTAAHWSAIVAMIERQRLERRAIDVLRLSLGQPDVRDLASALLLAAGVREARETLSGDHALQRPDRRYLVAMALARSGDKSAIGELSGLALDEDPLVRAAAVLGQARLGHGPANARLRDRLRVPATGTAAQSIALDPSALAEVLWRVGLDPVWLPWLQDLHATSKERDRLRLAVRLVQHGRLAQREELRAALAARAEAPLDPLVLRELVDALSLSPDARDVAWIVTLASERSLRASPEPIEREIDALLLAALVRTKHPRGLALLRDGLWRAPRSLACIAALQWIEASGLAALEAELEIVPPRSSEQDLRRAGFAYGRFCGWPALDRLARRKRADDPLLQGAWLGALSARSL